VAGCSGCAGPRYAAVGETEAPTVVELLALVVLLAVSLIGEHIAAKSERQRQRINSR
jgi:hypothetical protein